MDEEVGGAEKGPPSPSQVSSGARLGVHSRAQQPAAPREGGPHRLQGVSFIHGCFRAHVRRCDYSSPVSVPFIRYFSSPPCAWVKTISTRVPLLVLALLPHRLQSLRASASLSLLRLGRKCMESHQKGQKATPGGGNEARASERAGDHRARSRGRRSAAKWIFLLSAWLFPTRITGSASLLMRTGELSCFIKGKKQGWML